MRFAGWRRAIPCPCPSPLQASLRSGRSRTGSPGPTPPSARSSVSRRRSFLHRLARRPRTSSRCLQHPLFFDALQAPLQKIDLHGLPTDLPFQLRHFAFRPAALALARKGIARRLPELTPPTLQHVRVDLQPPCRLGQRYPCFQPPNGGQLELPGELPACQSHDSILHSMDFESYSFVSKMGASPVRYQGRPVVQQTIPQVTRVL